MSLFVNGLLGDKALRREIRDLSPDDLEVLKNALQGELISNPEIKEALIKRARQVISRLEKEKRSKK